MLQLIGMIAALIASMLLGPVSANNDSHAGVSGGGPVGRPNPHSTPTISPQVPEAPH
jgi:hypothetical protein